jgi:hypothetical protein
VYTLAEPDGTKRIVEYADEGHGFNALVKKEGIPKPLSPPVHEYAPSYGLGLSIGVGPSHGSFPSYGGPGPVAPRIPVVNVPAPVRSEGPEHPPVYTYGYEVADHKTGDFKSKFEVADGKSVKVDNLLSFIAVYVEELTEVECQRKLRKKSRRKVGGIELK